MNHGSPFGKDTLRGIVDNDAGNLNTGDLGLHDKLNTSDLGMRVDTDVQMISF